MLCIFENRAPEDIVELGHWTWGGRFGPSLWPCRSHPASWNCQGRGLPRKSPFHPFAGGQPPMSILLQQRTGPSTTVTSARNFSRAPAVCECGRGSASAVAQSPCHANGRI